MGGNWAFLTGGIGFAVGLIFDMKFMKGMHGHGSNSHDSHESNSHTSHESNSHAESPQPPVYERMPHTTRQTSQNNQISYASSQKWKNLIEETKYRN